MRSRRWVISLALILLAAAFMLFYTWPLLQINDQLRGLLERKMIAAVGKGAELQAVRATWGTLWLVGIELPISPTVKVSVDSIRATINPVKYLTSGLRTPQLIRTLHAYSPSIVLRPFESSQRADAASRRPLVLNPQVISRFAAPWSEGLLFGWEDGAIRMASRRDTIDIVTSFRGILRGEDRVISATVLGMSMSSSDNLTLGGTVNVDSALIRAYISLEHAALSDTFHIPGRVRLGVRPSDVTILATILWDSTGVSIQGDGSAAEVIIPVDTLFVAEFKNPTFAFSNTNVTLNRGIVRVLDHDIGFSGSIQSIFAPRFDVLFEIPPTSASIISSFVPSFPEQDLDGEFEGTVRVLGPVKDIQFESSLSFPYLRWRDWDAKDIQVESHGKPKLFSADISMGDVLESHGSMSSQVDLQGQSPSISLQFELAGNWMRQWIPNVPALTVKGEGTWTGQRTQCQGTINRDGYTPASWNLTRTDSLIQVSLEQGDRYSVVADIFDTTPPVRFRLVGKGLNRLADELFDRRILPENLDLSASVSSNQDMLDYRVDLSHLDSDWMITSRGYVDRQSGIETLITGDLDLHGFALLPALSGDFRMVWSDKTLTLRSLAIGDYLKATADIGLSPVALREFEISINRLDFDTLAARIPVLKQRGFAGIINAEFRGRDAGNRLAWEGNAQWFDGSIGGFPGFWGNLSLSGTTSTIGIREFQIGREIELLSYADGLIDLRADTVSIAAYSTTKTLDMFTAAIFGHLTKAITGRAEINAKMSGSLSNPRIESYVGLTEGQAYGISFQSVEFFADNLLQTIADGNVMLDSVVARIGPDFRLFGSGRIPVQAKGSFDFSLFGSGNLVAILHEITPWFKEADGSGKLVAHLSGSLKHPYLDRGELGISDGRLEMDGLFRQAENINLDVKIQSDGFVSVNDFEFRTHGTTLKWRNYPELRIGSGPLEPIRIEAVGLNLGIWVLDRITGAVQVSLPGFMEPSWEGNLALSGRVEGEKFLVAGPADTLLIRGTVNVSNAIVTYPFVGGGGSPTRFVSGVIKTLQDAHWDLNMQVGNDVHYFREITSTEEIPFIGLITTIFNRITADITVDPQSPGLLIEQESDTTEPSFNPVIEGKLESTQGSVQFLDLDFEVEDASLEFDRFDPRPWVSARARTTVTDSLGFPRTIYLTFYTVDSLTQQRVRRGRWGDFTLVLEDDQGRSQEEILRMLGYSITNISEKATSLGGTVVSEFLNEIMFRPVEQAIKKITGVDRVVIEPHVLQNVLMSRITGSRAADTTGVSFGAKYLGGSRLSVGKFLTRDIFLSYSGELASTIEGIQGGRLGLIHEWNVEYRMEPLSPYLVLDVAYQYDNLDRRSNPGILLRYSFGLP